MILDRVNGIIYTSISKRTEKLLSEYEKNEL